MKCPTCNVPTLVKETRGAKRRRQCRRCQMVLYTQEVVVQAESHGGDRRSETFKEKRK